MNIIHYKNRQNPTSLSCPTFSSTTYQIWSFPWNLELEADIFYWLTWGQWSFQWREGSSLICTLWLYWKSERLFLIKFCLGRWERGRSPASILLSELRHIPVALWMWCFWWKHLEGKRCESKNPQIWHCFPVETHENMYVCSSKEQSPLKPVVRWMHFQPALLSAAAVL